MTRGLDWAVPAGRGAFPVGELLSIPMKRPPSSDPFSPMGIAMEWAARIMAVALEMVLPGLAGMWLDRRLGTRFLVLLGFAFGLVAGMWHLIRATRDIKGGRQRRSSEGGSKRE